MIEIMTISLTRLRVVWIVLILTAMGDVSASAIEILPRPARPTRPSVYVPPGRTTGFTWVLTDAFGYRWDISGNGTISDGTNDAYDTGMHLEIQGSGFPGYGSGRLSADGKEVEVGPWQYANLQVSRRIFINTKAGYCRWIDIFQNNTGAEVSVRLRYYFNMGASTNRTHATSGGAEITAKDWGIVTCGSSSSSSRPAIVHVFGTPGSKFRPRFQFTRGSDSLYYHAELKVPARKAVGLCFFEAQRRPYESAVKFLKDFNPQRELALVPAPLRGILLNMGGPSLLLGDVELKRSDKDDLVVLRNGDEIRGRIVTAAYPLRASFGQIKLPAEEVIGMVSRSAEQDTVKLVLIGGQVVAGELTGGPLTIRLPDGNELKVPPKGLRQAAYRISEQKPEELTATDSLVLLRRGERLAFEDAGAAFEFLTMHGQLALAGADLRAIEMDTPSGGLHRAVFRNGSVLAGLLAAEKIPLRLKLGLPLELPRWQVGRIVFATAEVNNARLARLSLRNGDALYGKLVDKEWTIQSKFGDVKVDPADLTEGEFSADSLGHVKVTLRNETKLGGKLTAEYVSFKLEPGPALRIFIGHLGSFAGALPPEKPSETTQPAAPVAAPPTVRPEAVAEAAGVTARATNQEVAKVVSQLKALAARRAALQQELQAVRQKQIAVGGGETGKQLADQIALLSAKLGKLEAAIAQTEKLRATLLRPH